MDHWAANPNSLFTTDFKDELLFQGYWVGNAEGLNLIEIDYDSSLPIFESNHHDICHEEMDNSQVNQPQDYADIKQHVLQISPSLAQTQRSSFKGRELVVSSDVEPQEEGSDEIVSSNVNESSLEETSWTPGMKMEADDKKEKYVLLSWGCAKEEAEEEFNVATYFGKNELGFNYEKILAEFGQSQQKSRVNYDFESNEHSRTNRRRSLGIRKPREKRQTKPEKTISFEVVRQHFACSLKDAAKNMGVCPTTLKRICRQHGITRWPSRKIKKVNHSLKKLQRVIDSVEGAKGLIQIGSLYSTFPELSSPSPSLPKSSPFSSLKLNDNNSSQDQKARPDICVFTQKGTDLSDSSTSSQNSDSTETEEKQTITSINGLSSTDHASLGQRKLANISEQGSALRVKATFGESNIRFSLQPERGFGDLQMEIAKRFGIEDFRDIRLKYLDNDHESVLLTCDEDFDECKQLFRSSRSHTIKISLHKAPCLNFTSSCCS